MSVIATINVGANGATTLRGSSLALSTPADRQAFLALHRNAGSYLTGGNSFSTERYSPSKTPIIILTRSDRKFGNRDDVNVVKVESNLKATISNVEANFPNPILVEAGATLLTALVDEGCIEELYLNQSPFDGDAHFIDINKLLKHFEIVNEENIDGTILRKCRYQADSTDS